MEETIKDLIKTDYFVRNENPHYLIADGEMHIFSVFDGVYEEDTFFPISELEMSIEEIHAYMEEVGFTNIDYKSNNIRRMYNALYTLSLSAENLFEALEGDGLYAEYEELIEHLRESVDKAMDLFELYEKMTKLN